MRSTARWRCRPARSIRSARPDLTNTHPAATIGPFPQWSEPEQDRLARPVGPSRRGRFPSEIAEGVDIRPTHRHHQGAARPARDLRRARRRPAEGRRRGHPRQRRRVGHQDRDRSGLVSARHRRSASAPPRRRCAAHLFEQTAGMFPELVTRPDLHVFLPPIGGITVYLFGDVAKLTDPRTKITCRVHDECNGSDVFGSDICTCRPYLHSRHRGMRARRAAGRARHHRLQPQGRPRARRGDQVPGLQRPQAPGGRRRGRDLFRAHRMRRRRAGRALPAADAGRRCTGSASAASTASCR